MPRARAKTKVASAGAVEFQIGPPWKCFVCDAPAGPALRPWPVNHLAVDQFDAWAHEHIAYLMLPCKHLSRVALLDNAITPLDFPTERSMGMSTEEFRASLLSLTREALERLSRVLSMRGQKVEDPATHIVTSLLSGRYTPAFAIEQIKRISMPKGGEKSSGK